MFKHKCEMCGLEFETNNTRAKYCIYCRDKVQVQRNRAYAEKKKSGSAVKIGSEQVCPICGKTYTVTSGSQKYCKEQQRIRRIILTEWKQRNIADSVRLILYTKKQNKSQ